MHIHFMENVSNMNGTDHTDTVVAQSCKHLVCRRFNIQPLILILNKIF